MVIVSRASTLRFTSINGYLKCGRENKSTVEAVVTGCSARFTVASHPPNVTCYSVTSGVGYRCLNTIPVSRDIWLPHFIVSPVHNILVYSARVCKLCLGYLASHRADS